MENICNDVQILNLLVIFKNVINLVKIVIPVILIIFVILDIIKNVSSADVDNKKLFKSISKRAIAAVVIFLVPTILNIVLNVIPNNNMYYLDCYQNATKDNLITISEDNAVKSVGAFRRAVIDFSDAVDNGNYNLAKDLYKEAYVLYEPARQDVKLIYDDTTRTSYERSLAILKEELDNVKVELDDVKARN